jgi:hypothetical protein
VILNFPKPLPVDDLFVTEPFYCSICETPFVAGDLLSMFAIEPWVGQGEIRPREGRSAHTRCLVA